MLKAETRPSLSIRSRTSVDIFKPVVTTAVGCTHAPKNRSCSMRLYQPNSDARPFPGPVPVELPEPDLFVLAAVEASAALLAGSASGFNGGTGSTSTLVGEIGSLSCGVGVARGVGAAFASMIFFGVALGLGVGVGFRFGDGFGVAFGVLVGRGTGVMLARGAGVAVGVFVG